MFLGLHPRLCRVLGLHPWLFRVLGLHPWLFRVLGLHPWLWRVLGLHPWLCRIFYALLWFLNKNSCFSTVCKTTSFWYYDLKLMLCQEFAFVRGAVLAWYSHSNWNNEMTFEWVRRDFEPPRVWAAKQSGPFNEFMGPPYYIMFLSQWPPPGCKRTWKKRTCIEEALEDMKKILKTTLGCLSKSKKYSFII